MKSAERERLQGRVTELEAELAEFHKRKERGETAALLGYEKNVEAELDRLRSILDEN